MIYTYLFRRKSDGLTKIGKSARTKERFTVLGGDRNLEVIALIEGDCEKQLHKAHAKHRVCGEWFQLPDATLSGYIASCTKEFPLDHYPVTKGGGNTGVTILQTPVDKSTQAQVHKHAKAMGIPITVFCRMLIEHGLEEMAKGRLIVTQPTIQRIH